MSEAVTLHLGDCVEAMAGMAENSVDAIVCDPPYELGFMGKSWDASGIAYNVDMWRQALRVLKPGGHLLAFGGTRTYHRLACAIEDAGFEIRDQIGWVYGSGFPKSLDVSKAIDKAAGAVREVVGSNPHARPNQDGSKAWVGDVPGKEQSHPPLTAPATDTAKQWQGWGTALKPAWEPVVVARKPLTGTVAANVQRWGTGGLNIDACRVGCAPRAKMVRTTTVVAANAMSGQSTGATCSGELTDKGRFPANLIHDGSPEVLACFPDSKGQAGDVSGDEPSHTGGENTACYGEFGRVASPKRGDSGSAARFFYCAKASRADREEGLAGFSKAIVNITDGHGRGEINTSKGDGTGIRINHPRRNNHPTVKPTDLMRYLCRLVTPPDGVVLDPFMGSGSTGKAAILEGFRFVGIEKDAGYFEIAKARIASAQAASGLFGVAA